MQSRLALPTLFLNVHSFGGKEYAESEVLHSRDDAVRDAEEWSDRYRYTLTDIGRIDLREEFSERYHSACAHDERTDARIDSAKEDRFAREGR